jgi:HK97 family phage major capsid protein
MHYLRTKDDSQLRALSMDTVGEGGYLVPEVISDQILTGLNNLMFMRQICDVLPPVIGAKSLGLPYMSADATDGEWTTEILGATADDTLAIGKRSLTPNLLVKLVKASMKLLEHSPKAEKFLIDRIIYKMAVPQENKFQNGDGSGEPLGVFYASGINTDRDMATDNVATAFTADGLINCKYNVAAQYRKNARWLMHRSAVKMASKLKDGESRYIWQPSLVAGQPDTLLGHPIHESEYAPSTFTANLYVGIFGDFKFYQIVDGLGMTIQRLNELYAATNQVGFIPRAYADGMPVLPAAFSRVKLGA